MVHKFKLFETNIVLDVNSGAVHVFDDIAYEILDLYENIENNEIIKKLSSKYDQIDIIEALDDIASLKKDGLLYSKDDFEPETLKNNKGILKALCLHVSHDCNLRCKYCFASTGDFGMQRTLMDVDTGKKAVDLLIEKSDSRKNLEIDFFGGEPLLNFDVVKEIVNYARSKEEECNKNFRFTITTNALSLNEDNINFINENMYNLVLSIDGRKEVNDNMRSCVNGQGSYDLIIPKIKEAVKLRGDKSYYVRGTFTRENTDFSKDVIHLVDEGFTNISVEPVVAAKDSGYDIIEGNLPEIFKEYEELAYEYVERHKNNQGFNFFHFMIDLDKGPCITKRVKGCGSGYEYVAVTPEGDIYPCHQFVGMDRFKIGNVDSLELRYDVISEFKDSNIYTKEECKNCFAKFYCGGGCSANAYQFNKDINSTYSIGCEMQKKRIECALWIKTQL